MPEPDRELTRVDHHPPGRVRAFGHRARPTGSVARRFVHTTPAVGAAGHVVMSFRGHAGLTYDGTRRRGRMT
ncbi:hypothetical protein Axi01nite_44950 [Actinoplanes xinjiangensis]|nr:hypothetical protein Axi01nite_44950 [Actinoplanes xinjiangensis]